MTASLDGKVALVTGAASGIGRATAILLARAGARVVVADVDESGGETTVKQLRETSGEGFFVRADVSRPDEVEAMVRSAVERYGRLDCAHNNAGVGGGLFAFHECPREDWDRVMAVNLTGVWLCMKAEIAQMLRQGGGTIVNTASAAGLVGSKLLAAYAASKHAVVGLTRSAALGYAAQGIRVNAVCPAPIRTPLLERAMAARPELEQTYVAGSPMGRLGTPEEVAEAVAWLCSDAASFVTGVALPVDGGWLAR